MTQSPTTRLQDLLDLPPEQWDADARRQVVALAYGRLCLLARKILYEDFPRLKNVHGSGSVVNEAALRLLKTLDQVHPRTAREFFLLAAQNVRWVLLDMARKARQPQPVVLAEAVEQAVDPHAEIDPAKAAMWAELHQQVETLPEMQRKVVHCLLYLGMSQAEAAQLLEVHPRQISRLWLSARLHLARALPVGPGETI
jgi:RNA polymerase sigma factor (sigma-70 family)